MCCLWVLLFRGCFPECCLKTWDSIEKKSCDCSWLKHSTQTQDGRETQKTDENKIKIERKFPFVARDSTSKIEWKQDWRANCLTTQVLFKSHSSSLTFIWFSSPLTTSFLVLNRLSFLSIFLLKWLGVSQSMRLGSMKRRFYNTKDAVSSHRHTRRFQESPLKFVWFIHRFTCCLTRNDLLSSSYVLWNVLWKEYCVGVIFIVSSKCVSCWLLFWSSSRLYFSIFSMSPEKYHLLLPWEK